MLRDVPRKCHRQPSNLQRPYELRMASFKIVIHTPKHSEALNETLRPAGMLVLKFFTMSAVMKFVYVVSHVFCASVRKDESPYALYA